MICPPCALPLVQPAEQGQVYQAVPAPQYAPAPAPEGSFWSRLPPLVYIGVGKAPPCPAGPPPRSMRRRHPQAPPSTRSRPSMRAQALQRRPRAVAARARRMRPAPLPPTTAAAGVVLAGLLGKVMELVKGGPQKMQEMAMEQMMKQMMKQMGAPPGEAGDLGGRVRRRPVAPPARARAAPPAPCLAASWRRR